MNAFGEFFSTLRTQKGITQAELAAALGVTNKAVSKWETGEAMPETAQLLPISRIFGVTVDELLEGKRADNAEEGDSSQTAGGNAEDKREELKEEIKNHIFTRGKDGEPKTLSEKVCGFICGSIVTVCLLTYLLLGSLAEMWNPYWIIVVNGGLVCGIVGCISDMFIPAKRQKRINRGENPYTGTACGIIMLTAVIAYITASVFTGLWHPLWVIVAGGGLVCSVVGGLGDIFFRKK